MILEILIALCLFFFIVLPLVYALCEAWEGTGHEPSTLTPPKPPELWTWRGFCLDLAVMASPLGIVAAVFLCMEYGVPPVLVPAVVLAVLGAFLCKKWGRGR